MASIAPLNGQPLIELGRSQSALNTGFTQLSTGKRIKGAADDPSGYAIATALAVQAASVNSASDNVQTAFNASNVASGALQQISDIATQLRSLAVKGVNDFLSPSDRADLQAEANQLVQQANTVAQSVSFNGVSLLNGSHAGPQAGTPATATVTNNDAVANGGNVIAQVAAANPNFQSSNGAAQGFGGNATTDSTIQIQIVNNNGVASAVAKVVDNQTGQTVISGPVAAGGTISGFENVDIKVGNISLNDVGTTATVQIAQNVPANTQNNALQVQSGSAEGAQTNVSFPGVSSSQLRISNIDLSTSLSSTNAIGQLDNAIVTVGGSLANLGAQQVALQHQVANNNIVSNNLTASSSSIADANVGQTLTSTTLQQLRSQITTGLIANNNVLAGAVLGLFR